MDNIGIELRDCEARLQAAIDSFWQTRSSQNKRQGKQRGTRDRGERSAVTGGGHIDALVILVREFLIENGIPDTAIFTNRRTVDLPLYFRPQRDWDLVIVHNGKLIGCLEFKSHVGPSFGNNYNNRAQEAVGDAHDLAVAYREGLFHPSPKPWVGYLMLLEDTEGSRAPVAVRETHFRVSTAFHDASYAKRYEVTISRLVRESLYNAGALILTQPGKPPMFSIPNDELGFKRMVLSLIGHSLGVLAE